MTSHHEPTVRKSGVRKFAFRLAAIGLGLMPWLVLEAVLAMFGVGEPNLHEDPFVGFRDIRPLFVLNREAGRYEIPPSRQEYFRPDSFAAAKPADEFRIFCLGGSTVQGRPYAIETSFTTWLELTLNAADRRKSWQVVNCGGVSYASYRLIPILDEVLGYEPDLIVIYTGHNEFLEDRSYSHIKNQPQTLAAMQAAAARLRTYCLLRSVYLNFVKATPSGAAHSSNAQQNKPELPAEVDAMLDYRDGLQHYRRDDAWQRTVIAHYRHNLRRLVQMCRDAKVPLILMNPVSNLRDTPPFKSEHRNGLSPAELQRWESLWEEARQSYADDLPRAIELLHEALALDDQHAGLHYQLGQCFDAVGQQDAARQHYLQAKERDVCPLRMLEPMHAILFDVADRSDVPIVDVRRLIAEQCRDGIADDSWLADHVHPSIRGHQLIADALFQEIRRQGLASPRESWRTARDTAFEQHLQSLDEMYYHEGQRRLQGLQNWARGRAKLQRN